MSCEQVGEEDAERPDLCGWGLVGFLAEDLGGGVGCCAVEKGVVGARRRRVRDDCATEVDELDLGYGEICEYMRQTL